jgi:hypothetical protein
LNKKIWWENVSNKFTKKNISNLLKNI